MAIYDVEVRSVEACKRALDGLVDPWGTIVELRARNAAHFGYDEIVFTRKWYVGIFVGCAQGFAYKAWLEYTVSIL